MDDDFDSDEDYEEFYSYHEDYEETRGFLELVKHCLIPNTQAVSAYILQLLACCLIFRLASQAANVPATFRHVASSVLGFYALIYFFKSLAIDIIVLVAAAYIALSIFHSLEIPCGSVTSLVLFCYLIGNEFLLEPESWQKIRGPEMLVVMKVISIGFDLDSGNVMQLPNVWEYAGYILCPGTSVFGVWTSFTDYQNIFLNPVWNIQWVLKGARSLFLSLFCLMLSSCIVEWFIPSDSSLWWSMYRDALQFRTSHYFVSYLSETATIISGFGAQSVSEPLHIELPHSLVQVVIYWNKYMHKWLKIYVFRTNSKYGGLVAVMVTYTVSSLLHGLNYPLAAILMSLGIYTYIEHSIRYKLSVLMSACVASRPCPTPCVKHKHTNQLLAVALCNWFWSALAVFHLAYLGCIIDTSQATPAPFPSAFKKWDDVRYVSHMVAFVTYFFYICL